MAVCERVHDLNSTALRCSFVRTTADCHADESWLEYTTFVYCGPWAPYLPVGAEVLWLLLLFLVLGMTADDFLCPALVVVSRTLRLSESVAGVTLLAFGNGAPDIISSLAGIEQSRPSLVIGELLGAGTFVTSVVAGSVFLLCRFQLEADSFLRDTIFYLAASFWAFYLFYTGGVTLGHAVGFLGLYAVYIAVVLAGHFWKQAHPEDLVPVKAFVEEAPQESPARSHLLVPPSSPDWKDERRPSLSSMSSVGSTHETRRRRSSTGSLHRHHEHAIAAFVQASYEASVERRISQCSQPPQLVVSERTPLLGASSVAERPPEPGPPGPWAEFLSQLVPWDPAEWAERGVAGKVYDMVTFPLRFVLVLTVPVVDYENAKDNWCRPLNALHCVTAPLFVVVVLGRADDYVFDKMPAMALGLLVGGPVALLVWLSSSFERPPCFHWVFGYAGFALSVLWIYGVASELLGLLRAFGLVAGLSDAILGLTVLAWGNSLGDFVTNVAVARQGYPSMAMAACFGGPLLNLLMGVGLPYTIRLAPEGFAARLPLLLTTLVQTLYGGLVASLVLSLYATLFCRYQSSRVHGALLLALYALFLVVAVVVEYKLS
ncbi:hypothetical protein HPB48_011889 [Haemaphysalis longicornis]|uniref:Sodium/calcium exchanger membrane region domain-containing protein n=1 Tax=Haemaphysalis longicornis TaxID=44386 RepID=A0A9J6FK24_HAELO|nr:hypothetical protein HPB48_011889 [Haemaphysalis longicornis]